MPSFMECKDPLSCAQQSNFSSQGEATYNLLGAVVEVCTYVVDISLDKCLRGLSRKWFRF